MARAVCTFEIFRNSLSQTGFGSRSHGVQEIVGAGFPMAWQLSDAVCSLSTKNVLASVTMGETVIKSKNSKLTCDDVPTGNNNHSLAD